MKLTHEDLQRYLKDTKTIVSYLKDGSIEVFTYPKREYIGVYNENTNGE